MYSVGEDDDIRTFKLHTPLNISSFDYLSIEVNVNNIYEINDSFQAYLNLNDTDPSSTSFNLIGEDVWTGGKIITLNKDDKKFPL